MKLRTALGAVASFAALPVLVGTAAASASTAPGYGTHHRHHQHCVRIVTRDFRRPMLFMGGREMGNQFRRHNEGLRFRFLCTRNHRHDPRFCDHRGDPQGGYGMQAQYGTQDPGVFRRDCRPQCEHHGDLRTLTLGGDQLWQRNQCGHQGDHNGYGDHRRDPYPTVKPSYPAPKPSYTHTAYPTPKVTPSYKVTDPASTPAYTPAPYTSTPAAS